MQKEIHCKWCEEGHVPRASGDHWIVKSIIPARMHIYDCAYHKAGQKSPLQPAEETDSE